MDAANLKTLVKARWRMSMGLSVLVFVMYFGFIGLVAFAKDTMATQIVPGLSLGILMGAGVIIGAWLSTWAYVTWTNHHVDDKVASAEKRK